MKQNNYQLDRMKFKMQSFQEADMQHDYWMTKSVEERMRAAYYLISVAFDFDINNPPRLDKNIFSTRKHSE